MNAISPKTVLILVSSYGFRTEDEIAGIKRYARTAGWNVQTLECGRAAMSRYEESRGKSLAHVDEALRLWQPDGLVATSDIAPYILSHPALKRMTKVFWDTDPSELPKSAPCVYSDAERIAEDAVAELAKLGFPHYAYVPFDATKSWSIARGDAFVRKLTTMGIKPFVCSPDVSPSSITRHRDMLTRFVKGLPRPVAVFAANDQIAERVLSVCETLGLRVPAEVAVLGVDDELNVCESSRPTLSSIRSDYEGGAYRAAELLDELMRNPRARACAVSFGTLGVSRRMSTRRFVKSDRRVMQAIEYIRLHACDGIGVEDVVLPLGCSRRRAEMLFREEFGRSILDCIHETRIDEVKRRLSSGPNVNLSVISDACGYTSVVDMRRVFKRLTGHSPSDWRAQKEVRPIL